MVLRVYPSSADCCNTYSLYEDDGVTMEYADGRYAMTPLCYRRSGSLHTVSILPAEGTFAGQQQRRAYTLQLGTERPSGLTVDGRKAAAQFDDATGLYTVALPAAPVSRRRTVTFTTR